MTNPYQQTNINAPRATRFVAANDNITTDDEIVVIGGGAPVLTLPPASTVPGITIIIKSIPGTGVVQGSGGETIDGSGTFSFSSAFESLEVISAGGNWLVVGGGGGSAVQQPTIVSFYNDGSLNEVPGKGMVFFVGTNYPSTIPVYGYGFTNANIDLIPNTFGAFPPTPIGITNTSVTPDSGITPGVVDFQLDPGTPVIANVGQYFLVITDAVNGYRDLLPVRIYNAV